MLTNYGVNSSICAVSCDNLYSRCIYNKCIWDCATRWTHLTLNCQWITSCFKCVHAVQQMLLNKTLASQLRFTANRLLQVSRLNAVLCLRILLWLFALPERESKTCFHVPQRSWPNEQDISFELPVSTLCLLVISSRVIWNWRMDPL